MHDPGSDPGPSPHRPSPERPGLRDRFFTAWANAVTRRPLLVLLACIVLAGASVWLTLARLEFRSDRSELIDPSLAWQQRYAAFKSSFPRWDDAVIVVDLESAGSKASGLAYLAALEARLSADPHHWAFTAGFPREQAPAGLLLTQPLPFVKDAVAQMQQAQIVLTEPTLAGLLQLSGIAGPAPQPESNQAGTANPLAALLNRAQNALQPAPGAPLPAAKRDGLLDVLRNAADLGEGKPVPSVLGITGGVERLITRSGKLATILVNQRSASSAGESARSAASAVNTLAESVAQLRAHLQALRQRPEFASVRAGVTGVPVLESDETLQSTRDGERAGYLSLALIVVLMLFAYRGVVVPLFATAALLIGMAWSFAWATLSVGHLQLLSVVFASFLMGLGIDVAIHLIARLELVAPREESFTAAIARAFRGVGPGIVTATFTIAAAAGTMALTKFRGVAEMGIIAGGGVILCTIAVMSALPAMLVLLKNPRRRLRARPGGEAGGFLGALDPFLHVRPWLTVGIALVCTIAGAALALGVRYDPNVQHLLPTGVESAVWQDRLEADDAKSVWHAVVVAHSTDEARALTLKLAALPQVAGVDGAGMLFQPRESLDAKLAVVRTLPDKAAIAAMMKNERTPVSVKLASVASRIEREWKTKDPELAHAAARIAALTPEQEARVQNAYAADRAALAATIGNMHDAGEIEPSALPPALRSMMIGAGNELLLRVYPAPGKNPKEGVLGPENLRDFARAVYAVAPDATGPAIQIYESTRLITSAYRHAAAYALLAITILLLIDFRSIPDALCALLPVVVGAILMLAILRLADVELNFANLIVMPLIVGIGVGCGVHAVRRWRMQPFDPPPGLAGGSGRAITLTTITNIIGFATLITGQHRGIRSLGIVMSTGLAMIWLVTILVLPAVLKLRTPRKPVSTL